MIKKHDVISHDSRFALYAFKYLSRLFTIVVIVLYMFGGPSELKIGPIIINPDDGFIDALISWAAIILFFTIYNVLVTKLVDKHLQNSVEKVIDCGWYLEVFRDNKRHVIKFEEIKSVEQLEYFSPAKIRICLIKDYGFGGMFEFTSKPTNFWRVNDTSKTFNSIRNRINKNGLTGDQPDGAVVS